MSIMYNSNIRNESPISRRLADVRSHSSGCWVLCWSTNQDGFQGAILMNMEFVYHCCPEIKRSSSTDSLVLELHSNLSKVWKRQELRHKLQELKKSQDRTDILKQEIKLLTSQIDLI